MLTNNDSYTAALAEVKQEIAEARNRAVQGANAELIGLYWKIGQVFSANAAYGDNFIDSLAKDIRIAFPGIKGFSPRSLRYMAKFAREVDSGFCNSCCKIPWGHIVQLMDKTKTQEEFEWYAMKSIENGWSRSILVHQIEYDLYKRQALAPKVTNFEGILPAPDSDLAIQELKDPYIFDFITMREDHNERDIEEEMVSNITSLLLELGTGFAFMGRQYHLVVEEEDFYIDLLFYNTKLRCFIAIELKAGAFKPEYAGKLNFYLSAIDDIMKGEADRPTIGLLLCKSKSNAIAEYSLKDLNKPIGVSEYRLTGTLPEEYGDLLPTAEDILSRLDLSETPGEDTGD